MNIRIINLPKFIRSIFLVFLIIISISIVISNQSLSHGDNNYKTIYVGNGDTLWSIAKEEKEYNDYYRENDIRSIVDHIKEVNNLSNSNLSVNQKLVVPNL